VIRDIIHSQHALVLPKEQLRFNSGMCPNSRRRHSACKNGDFS
jgi:hypothetical protein